MASKWTSLKRFETNHAPLFLYFNQNASNCSITPKKEINNDCNQDRQKKFRKEFLNKQSLELSKRDFGLNITILFRQKGFFPTKNLEPSAPNRPLAHSGQELPSRHRGMSKFVQIKPKQCCFYFTFFES